MGGGGDAPKESPEAIALRQDQLKQLADVDAQDNYKRKRILNASRGTRYFAGAPTTRSAPSNTAYSAPKAPPVSQGIFRSNLGSFIRSSGII